MYNVLIVEDDPMVAMINEQYLKHNKEFCVVGVCRDGKSALEFLEEHNVDLIILDVYMPHMDGFETLHQIRKKKTYIDVIMVTAANDKESLEEALRLGIIDYLVKPFTFERFQMALDKYVAQVGALKELQTLNQKNIDFIIEHARKKSEDIHPKGIQDKTLQIILKQMGERKEQWLTGEDIAEMTGLTGVTVRRYMNYLSEAGIVASEMNYETGGRPCMLYRITPKM